MWILRRGQISGRAALDASSASYVGPGDIVSGAIGWYSPARAYTAAFAAGGTAIMDLVDQAGANPVTINILSTGYADITAISNWVTANSVSTIRVTKLYDQTGTGNHVTNATLAQMPALVLSSLNSLPGLVTTGARTDRLLSGNITRAQPISYSVVAKRTASTGASGWIGSNTNPVGLYPGTGADIWSVAGNTVLASPATTTESAFHAAQGILNGGSSAIVIDGSATTGAGGSTGYSASAISLFRANGGTPDGVLMEAGVWPSAFNATQYGDMNTNQHGTNGYNF
jgi:hypothetical protein